MEFCQVWTEDGVLLTGLVHRPAAGRDLGLAAVLVHGFSSRFYSQVVLGLAGGLAARGVLTVAGNNRGHDIGALLRRREGPPLLAGAAWERLEDAPYDVAAWLAAAAERAAGPLALIGHSLGGLKCALYCVERQDARVAALVLASPPLRMQPPEVPAGLPDEALVPGTRYPCSAQTLRSRHALAERLRPLELFSRLRPPTLVLFGERELDPDADATLDRLAGYGVDTAVIPGADHNYTGCEDAVAGAIAGWLQGVALEPPAMG
jgi:predicted alpha/beta-hydrolase family hydrolase